ncbi:MAG: acyl-CoA/acyl-ACP dehydrogenase [Novosphingobium sp.]|nr:acyl-CoA/acyl-ACP dehydrogenase [Novosphingobium sp.]
MNFDFSEDVEAMRSEVRRMLDDRYPAGAVRQAVDRGERFDRSFWALAGEMGLIGAAIPEAHGGAGLGHEALCMIAEEIGASLAPVPFASSVYLAAEAIALFGSEDQKVKWLPGLASGALIGCFALAEGPGDPREAGLGPFGSVKWPVVDGDIADIAVVAASDGLWVVELDQAGREPIETLDAVRASVKLVLRDVAGEKLQTNGWPAIARLLDRAAILTAFEQVGGTRAALDMAVGYARERYAFGRAIASFQAIKHKLADIYVALELARSNAYYGAWALENEADLPAAAAAARLAASEAYTLAARENIQTHGGMGFTWESDCHLHYRRARETALALGSSRYWRDRLIDHLVAAEAA